MSQCPCCSNILLKHWKQNKIFWYCPACRQEMPNLDLVAMVSSHQQTNNVVLEHLIARKLFKPKPETMKAS